MAYIEVETSVGIQFDRPVVPTCNIMLRIALTVHLIYVQVYLNAGRLLSMDGWMDGWMLVDS